MVRQNKLTTCCATKSLWSKNYRRQCPWKLESTKVSSIFDWIFCARKWASMASVDGIKRYCGVNDCSCAYRWIHIIPWKQTSWAQTEVWRALPWCQTSTQAPLSRALSLDDKVFWPSSQTGQCHLNPNSFFKPIIKQQVALGMYLWLWLPNISSWLLSTWTHILWEN